MMRRSTTMLWPMLFAGVLAGAFSSSAEAAMRYCKTTVTGNGVAESELQAKKQAMDDWKAKSVAAGIEHPAWRIAIAKSLDCESASGSGYSCTAIAEPCTISQVPLAP